MNFIRSRATEPKWLPVRKGKALISSRNIVYWSDITDALLCVQHEVSSASVSLARGQRTSFDRALSPGTLNPGFLNSDCRDEEALVWRRTTVSWRSAVKALGLKSPLHFNHTPRWWLWRWRCVINSSWKYWAAALLTCYISIQHVNEEEKDNYMEICPNMQHHVLLLCALALLCVLGGIHLLYLRDCLYLCTVKKSNYFLFSMQSFLTHVNAKCELFWIYIKKDVLNTY